MEAVEEDVSELCAQINSLHSSSDNATLKDVLEFGNDEPVDELSDVEEKDATSGPTIEEPEPTMCFSPKMHLSPRKSIFSTLGISGSKCEGASLLRTSLQSTKLSATESLAASLHRGLHVIEEQENNQNNLNSRRSFVGLSFDHLALKNQSPRKADLSQGEGAATFMCSSCKKLVDGNIKEQQESDATKQEESTLKVC